MNDLIIQAAGLEVTNQESFLGALASIPAGKMVPVLIYRDSPAGSIMTVLMLYPDARGVTREQMDALQRLAAPPRPEDLSLVEQLIEDYAQQLVDSSSSGA